MSKDLRMLLTTDAAAVENGSAVAAVSPPGITVHKEDALFSKTVEEATTDILLKLLIQWRMPLMLAMVDLTGIPLAVEPTGGKTDYWAPCLRASPTSRNSSLTTHTKFG